MGRYLALLALLLCACPSLWAQPSADIARRYRQGLQELRAERPAQAEHTWRSLLKDAPQHFRTHLALGKLLLKRNPQAASTHLNTAKALRPASDAVHYQLGRYLEQAGRLLPAAEAYRKAIKLNAKHYNANQRLRGVIRRLRGGQTVVKRAAETFWKQPNLAALTLFGKIVMHKSAPRQALLEFELLQKRLPRMAEIQLWIARAQRRLGNTQGVIAAYQTFLSHNPSAMGVRLLMLEQLLEAAEFRRARLPLERIEKMQARLNRREKGYFFYLKSGFLLAAGQSLPAAKKLLEAAEQGFDQERIARAFKRYTPMYPRQAPLWLIYGRWLNGQGRYSLSAKAFANAVKHAPPGTAPHQAGLEALRKLAAAQPPSMAARLELGVFALSRKDDAVAIGWLEGIPLQARRDDRVELLLGLAYRKKGEVEKAVDAFLRYVFTFPDREGLAFAQGNMFWRMGRREKALQLWGRNLKALRKYPESLLVLSRHHQEQGDAERELAVRLQLREALPEHLVNRLRLAEMFFARNNPTAAAAEWERVSGYRSADFPLLVRLGRLYLQMQQWEKAVSAIYRASQIAELEPALAERFAGLLLEQKRYAVALKFYWQIALDRPEHPQLSQVLPLLVLKTPALPEQRIVAARYAEASGNSELARELLEDLLRVYPGSGEGRVMLARLLMGAGEEQAAQRILAEVGNQPNPSELESLRALARLQRQLGQHEALMGTLERIAALDSEDAPTIRELAALLLSLHRPQAVQKVLSTALDIHPDDAELWYILAAARERLKQRPQARAALERLFALRPDHQQGRRLELRILRMLKDWKALAPALERQVTAYPEDVQARYELIIVYLNLLESAKARPHYLELKKNHPGRVRTLHRYFN